MVGAKIITLSDVFLNVCKGTLYDNYILNRQGYRDEVRLLYFIWTGNMVTLVDCVMYKK